MAAGEHEAPGPGPRLVAILASLCAAIPGYGLAEALSLARTSDAFMVAPDPGRLAVYALALLTLAGLALALEIGGPPIAARGRRAARSCRAAFRHRFRRGRRRAEIAKVEVGLTVSFGAVLLALAAAFGSSTSSLVIAMVVAVFATLQAIASLCRLVGHDPTWSAMIGFPCGLAIGIVLT